MADWKGRQLQNDQQHLIREMQLQAENTRRTAEKEAAHSRNHYEAQITDLNQRIADLEGRLAKVCIRTFDGAWY
jgi:hypothetical protein